MVFQKEHSTVVDNIVLILLVYSLAREWFFYHQTHKLLDKLMSRNYQEFQFSNTITQPVKEKVVIEEFADEDFARQASVRVL